MTIVAIKLGRYMILRMKYRDMMLRYDDKNGCICLYQPFNMYITNSPILLYEANN